MKRRAFTIIALCAITLFGLSIITSSLSSTFPSVWRLKSTHGLVDYTKGELSRLHTEGKYIKNAYGKTIYLRGVCVPQQCWLFGPVFKDVEQEIQYMSEWGCNFIRLVCGYDSSSHRWLSKIGTIVNWAGQRGIYTGILFYWYSEGGGAIDTTGWNWVNENNHGSEWDEWKDFWTTIATQFKGNPYVVYDLMNEGEFESVQTAIETHRWVIDAIRDIDPTVLCCMEAINVHGWNDPGLRFEDPGDSDYYPLDRDNILYSAHKFYWNNDNPTSKTSFRNWLENVGAEWLNDNGRAYWQGELNYDATGCADNGETWMRNAIEVLDADGYAAWTHWGWISTDDVGGTDFSLITSYGTSNPTHQGQILQEYLP